MKKKLFLIGLLCLVIIYVCSQNESNEKRIKEQIFLVMQEENLKVNKIYHLELIKNGVLFFYEQDGGVNAGLVKDVRGGWKCVMAGGRVDLNTGNDLHYCALHFSDVSLSLIYGINKDPEIERVVVETSGIKGIKQEKQAKIIQTEGGLRIWFNLYSGPLNSQIKVIGHTKSGKIFFLSKPEKL
ncbi:hypothetical protein Dtox_3411 [Desulfofarcimen acetoxidans DSM 771]|uniref:Uncharacterized protein n=1 Tax=Desulfofarcimen acetoxidans (strain ATCC 49208 / DSM 771 / KCTC 5769 / VKM B-1644 / 5575) TaxID=485916 RepID=C8W6M6_DESAS|nr:hypothetical protein [Desulfofarcimen acetoxidans]ACV64135.1 hypothetical protein Dtox_3411 [Desulfofarcimen acetoxidans DSM 771]